MLLVPWYQEHFYLYILNKIITLGSNEKAGWKLCATFLSSWPGVLRTSLRRVLCRAAQRNRSDFVQRDRNLDKNGDFDASCAKILAFHCSARI